MEILCVNLVNGVIDCAVFALNLTCQPIKRGKTSNAPKIFDLSFFLFSRYIRRSDSSGDLHPLPIDDNPLTFLSYYFFFFSFFLFVFMWMLLVENERHHDESIHLDVFFCFVFLGLFAHCCMGAAASVSRCAASYQHAVVAKNTTSLLIVSIVSKSDFAL